MLNIKCFTMIGFCALSVAQAAVGVDKLNAIGTTAIGDKRNPVPTLELEIQEALKSIDESIGQIQVVIRARVKGLHRVGHSPEGPQYAWQDESPSAKVQKKFKFYSSLQLQSLLRQVEALESRRRELLGDLELFKLRNAELSVVAAPKAAKAHSLESLLACASQIVEPLDGSQKISVVQPFGKHKDQETGLEWKSSGWWLTAIKSEIKSCAAGIVVFAGHVAGRGRVVLIDHGAGSMTLYANLSEDEPLKWSRGVRVAAGAVLGSAPNRVYFEVRRDGSALDPRTVLSAAQMGQFRF